ncbi:hypothetical protein ABBQ38_011516 [Trebouxia sp. C0009 RCD-2024]
MGETSRQFCSEVNHFASITPIWRAQEQHPKISLHTDHLFLKLVKSRRGGYCFEQNLLFAAALRALGFAIYLLAARVCRTNGCRPGESSASIIHNQPHVAIGVVIEGVHWVTDVGYGGKGLRLPIRNDLVHVLDDNLYVVVARSGDSLFSDSTLNVDVYQGAEDSWQAANGQCLGYAHRLRTNQFPDCSSDDPALQIQWPGFFVQALDSHGHFQDQYFMQFQETKFAEFEMLNWYTSTCPDANHLKNVVVAIQTPVGRNTYNGKEFKVFEGTSCKWLKQPETEQEQYKYLQQLFELQF